SPAPFRLGNEDDAPCLQAGDDDQFRPLHKSSVLLKQPHPAQHRRGEGDHEKEQREGEEIEFHRRFPRAEKESRLEGGTLSPRSVLKSTRTLRPGSSANLPGLQSGSVAAGELASPFRARSLEWLRRTALNVLPRLP